MYEQNQYQVNIQANIEKISYVIFAVTLLNFSLLFKLLKLMEEYYFTVGILRESC